MKHYTSQMRIVAFINNASAVKKIFDHIGESTQPQHIAPRTTGVTANLYARGGALSLNGDMLQSVSV